MVPADSVQLAEAELNVPVLFVLNVTIPVGPVGDDEVSVTAAVQVVLVPTLTEPGAQVTDVVVVSRGAGVAVKTKLPWLAECDESPA